MGAIWLRFRADMRARWLGALVLVVLVGAAGGAVLTAVAGAQRTASSFERFHDAARSPDVLVQYPAEFETQVRDVVAAAPGVEAVTHLRALAAFPVSREYLPMAVAEDGGLHRDFERGKLLAGRFERRDAPDEVALSEAVARQLGVGVGDTLELLTFTPEQLATILAGESESSPEPRGPRLRLRVVGVYRSPFDLGAVRDDVVPVLLPRAALTGYEDRIGFPPVRIVAVRLVDGEAGAAAFFRRLRTAVPDRRISLQPATLTAGIGDSLDVLALGLLAFAAVVGAAGLVAVGQALGRRAVLAASDDPTLRALGMTRPGRISALAVDTIPIALLGGLLAAVIAAAASPLMPIGVGRRAEPEPGIDVDPLVLGTGLVAVAAAVLAVGALGAWRAERAESRRDNRAGTARPSATVRALARRGARPTAVAGVRFALEPGRGGTAVPVRSVLVAAVVGTAGVVAVLVLGASLDHLVAGPPAWGWTFDTHSGIATGDLTREPAIAAVTVARFAQVTLEGRPVDAVTWRTVRGEIEPAIVDGRAPKRATEVALGGDTLGALDLDVGGTVTADGRDGPVRFRVVGQALFPSVSDAVPLADGALLTPAGLRRIDFDELEGFSTSLVRFAPGASVAAERRWLARQGDEDPADPGLGPQVPSEIERLQQLESLQLVLAGFLGLLGVVAVGHGLVSAVRRRRRDLALLKTLGFRRGQVSSAIAWQATTVAFVGAFVGIPVGIVAGRAVWSLLADGLGVASVPDVPPIAVVAITLAVFAVANAVAYVPGRVAARTQPAAVLRAE